VTKIGCSGNRSMAGSEGGWAEDLGNRGIAGRRSLSALGEGRDGGGSRDFDGRGGSGCAEALQTVASAPISAGVAAASS
jgi:hypothetical protein